MNESKIELTERLRHEGRWEEASRFKDEVLKKLRSEGMTKADAADEAWRRMDAKYPPLASIRESAPETADATTEKSSPSQQPKGTEPDIDIDDLLDRIHDGQPTDLILDTLWVYHNLVNQRAKPCDAPSLGAWALLQWARKYQMKFFEVLLPKAMANKPYADEENLRQEKKSIEELERVLEKMMEGIG